MEFHRKAGELSALSTKTHQIRVVGVGSAGASILERIHLDGGDAGLLIYMDTDLRSLSSSVAGKKVQLGSDMLCGMPTGGDPELGREAALRSEGEIRSALEGADLVFLCTGLGGGTASGAAPEIARIAKEAGCFVLVFVTLPFHFEGRRRLIQAEGALDALRAHAGALLTFENDKMGELIVPKDGVDRAFELADKTICHSVRAITTMLQKPGMIQVGMNELLAVLNGQDARCLFGFGKATGKTRADRAVSDALENPLLSDGDLLDRASTVLVHISGNRSVTLSEVETVMGKITEGLNPSTEILFGVSASDELGNEIWVAVISSIDRSLDTRRHPTLPQDEMVQPALPVTPVQPPPAVPVANPVAQPVAPPQKSTPAPRPVPLVPPPTVAPQEARPAAPRTPVPPAAPVVQPAPPLQPQPPGPNAAQAVAVQVGVPAAPAPTPVPEAEPPLVDMGPPKPKLKAPLPPPSPAPLPAKPTDTRPPAPRKLVSPQHLMGDAASPEPVGHDSPVAAPPADDSGAKVVIEYEERGEDAEPGQSAATITLEQPKPSVASKSVTPKARSPLMPKLPAGTGVPAEEAPVEDRKIVAMPREQPKAPQMVRATASRPLNVPAAAGSAPAAPSQTQGAAKSSTGRFDQVEPTIIDGQDMDVPTFLRNKKRG